MYRSDHVTEKRDVSIGEASVQVEANWFDNPDGDPSLHVSIGNGSRNGRTVHLPSIGSDGLRELSRLFLALDHAIYADPPNIEEPS